MTPLLIVLHVMACLTLILVILLQVGRGHGLSGASFGQSGVQTLFGTRAADFLAKATSVMACVFILTCVSLDVIYSRRSHSLIAGAREERGKKEAIDFEKIKKALEQVQADAEKNKAAETSKALDEDKGKSPGAPVQIPPVQSQEK